MVGRCGRGVLLCGAAVLGASAIAGASERSQLLVARAQSAYHARDYARAEALFAEAAAADGDDAGALYGLGLALGKLGHWEEAEAAFAKALRVRPDFAEARGALDLVRRGRSKREDAAPGPAEREAASPGRWQLRAATGVQYDSNVRLEPHTAGAGDRDDAAFLFVAGGHFDLLRSERLLLRLDYDFYQTLHPDLDDFDFRSHRVAGLASWAVRRWLRASVQGGYDHYTLGSHAYLQEPFVLPFLSIAEGSRGTTQLLYRHGEQDYLHAPFDGLLDRDGPSDRAGFDQRVFLGGQTRYATLGYEYGRDRPRRAAGADFDRVTNQAHVGVGLPVGWETAVELLYLYRNDDYTKPNSQAGFRKTRQDDEHHFYAGAKRDLTRHLNVQLAYYGTINASNIGVFDYRRSVVSLLLEVVY